MTGTDRDLSRMITSARKGRLTRRMAWALGLGLALTAILSGVIVAQAVLQATTVKQTAESFAGSSQNDPNYPTTPTLQVSSVGSTAASNCATSTNGYSGVVTAGGSTAVAVGLTGSCTAGDFSELISYTLNSTLVASTSIFELSATWTSSGSPTSATVTFTLAVSAGSGATSLNLQVDFGASSFPVGGIQTMTWLEYPQGGVG